MLILRLRNKLRPVETLAQASQVYCAARDKSRLGASNFREATVTDARGTFVARISYNGRVWTSPEWKLGEISVYDPA